MNKQKLKINLSKVLRDWQKDFLRAFKRFNVLVIHRRAGKTVVTILLLVTKALEKKGDYGYIAPTYRQAKKIAWRMLQKFGNQIGGFTFNGTELLATLENGSTITLFGAEQPDSLRGLDLCGVIFDEYAQQPNWIYGEIIFPMINANGGWVTWIGTPKGKNAFYNLYQRAIKDDKFHTMLLKYTDTKLLSEEQIQDAKEEMVDEEFEQEYNCSWTASIRGAVYGKELSLANEEGRVKKGIYDENLEVTTFWDLGMSDQMAIIFIQNVGNEIRIVDAYSNTGYGFEHYANILTQKGYSYKKHYFPHDIANRELTSGESRLVSVRRLLGSECYVVPKTTIEEGISATRLCFKNIFIEKALEEFINNISLYQYEYDDKLGEFKKKPKHDFTSHFADALRYMGVIYRSLTKPKQKKRKKVIVPNQRWN